MASAGDLLPECRRGLQTGAVTESSELVLVVLLPLLLLLLLLLPLLLLLLILLLLLLCLKLLFAEFRELGSR